MGVENQTVSTRKPAQDSIAFAALTVFAVVMYSIPSEWIPALAPLRLALISSIVAAGFMLVRRLAKREAFFFDGVRGAALIGFGLLVLTSQKWALYPAISQEHSTELLKLVAIYLTMVNVITTPRRLAIFAGAMVLSSMVTSWHVIDWYQRGEGLVEGFRARWLGVYADPNHMAMDIGIIIPLAVAFIARKQTPTWLRLACIAASGLAVTAIVYSHSRGGFIGLIVAMAVWMFLEKSRRMHSLIVAGVLAVGLLIFAPKSFWQRNETVAAFQQDDSAMGRIYAWEVAANMSSANPILGVGAGNFRFAWPLYAPHGAHTAIVAHNVYLDVVGELGFVGLLFFLVFTGGAAGGAFASTESREFGWLANGIAGAVAGYAVCNLFSGYTLSAHFYVLFALAACAERIVKLELASSPATELKRTASAAPVQTVPRPALGA